MNPTLSGIVSLLIFSIGTVLIALSGDVPGYQLSAITLCIGAITLFLFLYARNREVIRALKAPVSTYFLVTMGVGLYVALLNLAFKSGPAFEINILNYLWPVFLVVFSNILHKRKFLMSELAGMFLGFLGISLVFLSDQTGVFYTVYVGHYYAVGAAIVWALYSSLIHEREYSVVLLVPAMFVSGIICAILHLLFEETVWTQPFSVWAFILLLSVSRFAYAMWDYGVRHGDKILLSSLSYFVPVLSVIYFSVLGFQPISSGTALGGILIIISSLIVNSHRIMRFHKRKRIDPL